MKMIVTILVFCTLHLTVGNLNDKSSTKYEDNVQSYQLTVPGRDPITIIESKLNDDLSDKLHISDVASQRDDIEIKHLMTHIIHDINGDKPRCYGPSCQEGFDANEGPQGDSEELFEDGGKFKDFDFSNERIQAIAALAAKLKKPNVKTDRFPTMPALDNEDESKVYTSWNRIKVKQHKHPFDDKDGWVTMEPVAWSTSKISKWKPNVKKHKPSNSYWNEDEDTKFVDDDRFPTSQDIEYPYTYTQKKPVLSRPGYINNKLHIPEEYETELPSKPSWTMNKPQQPIHSIQSSWSPDESRRPYKPNCDKHEVNSAEDSMYYGMADSVVAESRPPHTPYEYDALYQPNNNRLPIRRPTQVVYAGPPKLDDDNLRPPYGDGQWVLLSTTKGYKNKKRQRSMSLPFEKSDNPSITSHQAIALTVLPAENPHVNMTTSHGGLLEVEKSFQTVEESKRVMDLKGDLDMAETQLRPVKTKAIMKKIIRQNRPDSSTILAAVGAGMVPATMAMVVPMMLGRRRRRDVDFTPSYAYLNDFMHRIE